MRTLHAFLVVVLGLIASASSLTGEARATPQVSTPAGPERNMVPVSDNLSVSPGPGEWTNRDRPTVVITILDPGFVPDFALSQILFDGVRLIPEWNEFNRTIWIRPDEAQADGPHVVDVRLTDFDDHTLATTWMFYQDTVPPVVDLDPLPSVADKRVFPINGTVVERNLDRLMVNQYGALIEGERFTVSTLLWPGLNDILVTAVDRASNRGLAKGGLYWFPPSKANVTYEGIVHPNASFVVRLPATWDVRLDYELEGGFRADIAAVDPEAVSTSSGIAIVSRATGISMNEGVLLVILADTIQRMGGPRLEIIAQPRLIPRIANASAAQFSVVDTLPSGEGVFRIVTGIWSRSVNRIWLVIGSVASEEVEHSWHALQTATDTFRVIEPPAQDADEESPILGIRTAIVVTTAGIISILSIFAATLYSIRRHRMPARRQRR